MLLPGGVISEYKVLREVVFLCSLFAVKSAPFLFSNAAISSKYKRKNGFLKNEFIQQFLKLHMKEKIKPSFIYLAIAISFRIHLALKQFHRAILVASATPCFWPNKIFSF